jgi:hypothetical protein
MPRNLKPSETRKAAKGKRQFALDRPEMTQATVPRVSAAGAMSMAVKARDPEMERMIAEFQAKRTGGLDSV